MSNIHHHDDSIRKIKRIDFDILGNEEIKEMSVIAQREGINATDLYENLEPKKGGVNDPALGVVGSSDFCDTCGLRAKYCPGHFGHISLGDYVYNMGYLKNLKRILDVICLKCSKLLVNKNEPLIKEIIRSTTGEDRLKAIKEATKSIKYCSKKNRGCGAVVSKIKCDVNKGTGTIKITSEMAMNTKDEGITDDKKQKLRLELNPEVIFNMLGNISAPDAEILGMKPERSEAKDMIHKEYPVLPLCARPPVQGDFMGGSTREDSLTHKLADIVKSNKHVVNKKDGFNENRNKFSKDHVHLLQCHVALAYNKSAITSDKNDAKNRLLKSYVERINGKHGRVRKNLMGKRGDFSGRSVVTPYPDCKIYELGVPVQIAMILTFPEKVTMNNREKLQELVDRGPYKYPGANVVFQPSRIGGSRRMVPKNLKVKKNIELEIGNIVERHLVTGDIVNFNRQPTLHRQSIMGHKIRVIDDPSLMTFRMSLSATGPYNADFDGDEMNIFAPQTEQGKIELEELAYIGKQFISPASSRASFGIVQDGLLGAYNMTSPSMKIKWRSAMNLISNTSFDDFSYFKKRKDEYKGTDVFSLIIPKKINVKVGKVEIDDGDIVQGQLDKKMLKAGGPKAIGQLIWDEYGEKEATDFINDTQWLIDNFNMYNGFTVGIGDVFTSKRILKNVSSYISSIENRIATLITTKENKPDYMEEDIYEVKILSELDIILGEVSNMVFESTNNSNNFKIMANSGSKGNASNLGQMAGAVGLQVSEGNLMPKKYNRRTTAYFLQDDDRGPARGLIRNSFMKGLTWQEFIWLNMKARESMIDKSIKTAETGYLQRKLIKMLEDLKISYDGTVRTSKNSIVQCLFGGTGADTIRLYPYKMNLIHKSNSDIMKEYVFTKSELARMVNFSESDNMKMFHMIRDIRNSFRNNIQKSKLNYKLMTDNFSLPVNFRRIVTNYKKLAQKKKEKVLNDPKHVLMTFKKCLRNDVMRLVSMKKADIDDPKSFKNKDDLLAKQIIRACFYEQLSPKKIINDYKLSKSQFNSLMKEIVHEYNHSIVDPGEMVGIIAAQSVGEPLTQMTLNSIHHVGHGSISYTIHGVPRLKEVLSGTDKLKTPQMVIYLTEEFKKSREMANKIASNIKYTDFSDIRGNLDVYYDSDPYAKGGFMEKDGIGKPFYNKNLKTGCQKDIDNLPYLIRIELLKDNMIEKDVSLLEVKTKLCNYWERRFIDAKNIKKEEKKVLNKITSMAVLSNFENDERIFLHIRFNGKDASDKDRFNKETINNFIDLVIDKLQLKGIKGIKAINTIADQRQVVFGDKNNNEITEYDKNNDEEEKVDQEFVVYASGVNMTDIRYIIGVDLERTMTNDIKHVYQTFGIEVARSVLLRELIDCYEKAGHEINYHHATELADLMTKDGTIMSIDRNGIGRSDQDPLSRASFEKTPEQFLTAATFGESDNMRGVSAKIMTGQIIEGGTGYPNIRINTDMILNSEHMEEDDYTDGKTIEGDVVATDIIKNDKGSRDIFIPV